MQQATIPRRPAAPARAYTVAEAGRICGLTARAIRLYEERGLIGVPRNAQGARSYDDAALERLAYIAFARRAGFTLKEIGELLAVEQSHGQAALVAATVRKCRAHAAALEERRRELVEIADSLSWPSASPLAPLLPRRGAPPAGTAKLDDVGST